MEKNRVRTTLSTVTLQRLAGIALCMFAWVATLFCFASLCTAAVHNKQAELGLGLDSTILGAKAFLLALGVSAVGIPLWVFAEIELQRRTKEQPRRPDCIPPNADILTLTSASG